MRVDVLHKRLVHDIAMLQPVVDPVFPVGLPVQYQNRSMNLRGFIDRLNTVTNAFNIHNEIEWDKTVDPGQVSLSGLWISESELPENESDADIRVIWHVHPGTKRLKHTTTDWNRRRYFWWQIAMHEVIHRHQEVHRTLKGLEPREFLPQTTSRLLKESQGYYGHYDEIEAHSHNAALEFLTWWNLPYKACVEAALTYHGRVLVPTYVCYMATYMDTPRHPAYLTFKRKVKAWFDVMQKNPEVYRTLQLSRLVS